METLLIWVGVLALLALVSSSISLIAALNIRTESQVRTTVRQLVLDMTELFDTVEKWTRRDRVRRLRDGREAAGLDTPVATVAPSTKAELRALARSKGVLQ